MTNREEIAKAVLDGRLDGCLRKICEDITKALSGVDCRDGEHPCTPCLFSSRYAFGLWLDMESDDNADGIFMWREDGGR